MSDYQNLFSLERGTALVSGGTGSLGNAVAQAFLDCGPMWSYVAGTPKKRML